MQNLHSMPTPGVESRWQIIHIFKPLNNIRGVARELDIPRSVVQQWVRRYQQTGGVDAKPKSGRTPAIPHDARPHMYLTCWSAMSMAPPALLPCSYSKRKLTRKVVHRTTVVRAARSEAAARGNAYLIKMAPQSLSVQSIVGLFKIYEGREKLGTAPRFFVTSCMDGMP